MHARVVLGLGKGVIFRDFRGDLIEGFHCMIMVYSRTHSVNQSNSESFYKMHYQYVQTH